MDLFLIMLGAAGGLAAEWLFGPVKWLRAKVTPQDGPVPPPPPK